MIADEEDVLGAAQAAAALGRRIRALQSAPWPVRPDGGAVLEPPLSERRDHVLGGESPASSLVVFGAYGAPQSRALGRLLTRLHETRPGALRIAWRHLPAAGERGAWLALAAEAAAVESRFWSMTHELLALHHLQLRDVHDAARRAGLDFDRLLKHIRAGVGAERIIADVASAAASGVRRSPAVFVNRRRFQGDLDAETVWAALHGTGGHVIGAPAPRPAAPLGGSRTRAAA